MTYTTTAQRATASDHSQSDARFFADHPDAPWRLTIRRFSPTYFAFKITTRDGGFASEGDQWDIAARMERGGGSPLERLRRAVQRILSDQNRTYRVRAA